MAGSDTIWHDYDDVEVMQELTYTAEWIADNTWIAKWLPCAKGIEGGDVEVISEAQWSIAALLILSFFSEINRDTTNTDPKQ